MRSIRGDVLIVDLKGSPPSLRRTPANGVNVLMCDGSVRFLSALVDVAVYAKLITPADSKLLPTSRHTPVGSEGD